MYKKKVVITDEYIEYLKSLKEQGITDINKICTFKPIYRFVDENEEELSQSICNI